MSLGSLESRPYDGIFVCLEGKSSGWFPISGYFQIGISVWNNHLKWCHDLFFQPLCGWWKLGRQRQSGAIHAMGRCGIDARWDSWRCKRILFLFYTIACIKSDFNPSFSILWMNWGCGNIRHILWTIPTSWAGLQLSDVFFVGRHFVSLNQCQETAQSWVFSLAPQGGTAWKVKVLSAKWSLGTCLWSMVCWLEVNSNWTWGGTCFEGLILERFF